MPFKSVSQMRKCFKMMSKSWDCLEWLKETKDDYLPLTIRSKKKIYLDQKQSPMLKFGENKTGYYMLAKGIKIYLIKNNKKEMIKIYVKKGCPFCALAIDLLKKKNKEFTKIIVSKPDYEYGRTVPQIFIDGKFIGGYSELKKKFSR
jgi:glutaredoxin 3